MKPVLCKVHGYAVAGGFDKALCSDMAIMAETTEIGYMPARLEISNDLYVGLSFGCGQGQMHIVHR